MTENDGTHLRHADTAAITMSAPTPKPTSRDNQMESAVGVWKSGPTEVGVWECGPGEFTADRRGNTEICHIITGSGTVVGDDGVSTEVGPGSLLVLPKGWCGTWKVRETIRKSYVTIV